MMTLIENESGTSKTERKDSFWSVGVRDFNEFF